MSRDADAPVLVGRVEELAALDAAFEPVREGITGDDRERAEVSMLALHLLQSSLVFINTQLLQAVLRDPAWAAKLTKEDRRGLSPLFWSHVNPYGSASTWTPASTSPPH